MPDTEQENKIEQDVLEDVDLDVSDFEVKTEVVRDDDLSSRDRLIYTGLLIFLSITALILLYILYGKVFSADEPGTVLASEPTQVRSETTVTEVPTTVESTEPSEPEAEVAQPTMPLPFHNLPYETDEFMIYAGAYGPQRQDYDDLLSWIKAMQAEIEPLEPGQYKVRVFLKEQVIAIYELGVTGQRKLCRAFACSSGAPETPTPIANTVIGRRHEEGLMFDGSYGMYCSQINGNILIHSVPSYGNNGEDGVSPVDWNKLGTPASHGCIRVAFNVSKFIFQNVPVGSPVEVLAEASLFPEIPNGLDRLKIPVDGPRWDPTNPNPQNPYIINPELLIDVNQELPE